MALGVAGLKPLRDYRGKTDNYGYELRVSVTALADEIASAANLVMGKRDSGVLIHLNRKYKSKHASVKITGIGE